jgi:hypothetical protein
MARFRHTGTLNYNICDKRKQDNFNGKGNANVSTSVLNWQMNTKMK